MFKCSIYIGTVSNSSTIYRPDNKNEKKNLNLNLTYQAGEQLEIELATYKMSGVLGSLVLTNKI